jgi:CheY-like chemotaxis protein
MTDEFFSLKILLVSEAAAERSQLRQVATQASTPIEVTERDTVGDPTALAALLSADAFDAVFFDSRFPKLTRQSLLDCVRAAPNRPLSILIGPSDIKTREVLTDGIESDGTLAKPIDGAEAKALFENCVRARLPKRVLIVDDSSTVRTVVRKVLLASRYKLEPDEAADGATAIDLAKKANFDIVFLDCQMPGIDGFDVLAEFRKAHERMKIVMMTGTRDVRIEDRARAEGAKDFLYKPFFAKDIDVVLNRLFGLAR